MSDYEEISHESWFSRIGGAIKGVVFGIILAIVAFPVLWFNEGSAVKNAKAIEEGGNSAISVSAEKLEPSNEGKLVHLSGLLKAEGSLKDEQFNLERENVLSLERRIEIFQWEEKVKKKEEKNLGGSKTTKTTYSYKKGWHDKLIDSSKFKKKEEHKNPSSLAIKAASKRQNTVKLGAFMLNDSLISKAGKKSKVQADSQMLEAAPQFNGKTKHLVDGAIFYGADPSNPQVGDLKVSFSVKNPETVTIVAKQSDGLLTDYQTSNGVAFLELEKGALPLETVISNAQSRNSMKTWIFRAVGFGLFLFGIFMILNPLVILADIVPFIGNIVSNGLFIIALVISRASVILSWVLVA